MVLALAVMSCGGRTVGLRRDAGSSSVSDGSSGVCVYNGRTYRLGDTFPAKDGCNTCKCLPVGDSGMTTVGCTLVYCPGP